MDIFSHGLWGYALFGRRGLGWLACFFGVFPDLVSFGILTVINITNGSFQFGKPDPAVIPTWTFISYDWSHSLVIALITVFIVWKFNKLIAFTMLAWIFHILLDIPTHSKEFFPTKFLWPLSDIAFNGISWGTPWIWLSNAGGLSVVYGIMVYKHYKKGKIYFLKWTKRQNTI
ncbi:MAG: hypothetical protein PHO00_06865 [bacterium]|nr:hypothetical protein [bacterium]